MSILFLHISLLTMAFLKCVNSCLSDPWFDLNDTSPFYFFASFIDLSSIDRPYIKIHCVNPIKGNLCTKLTEQHDHNMQSKKERKRK
jgi:hypothetical protein